MDTITAIKKMVERGRSSDLLDLMQGESPYTSADSELILNGLEEKQPWRMALEHLKFIVEFGNVEGVVEKDSKFYSAYPEEFQQWLSIGAPGLVKSDLEEYLKANPVE